ncbi:hypothetical protein FRC04_006473 [Tulasnella sp. 424]|nr:hypothetical protein FRC04_006473 [Tulasnella sp. 424]KAG8980519.1 hypothetical protein FRC05_006152 [Tulasnella sp. 425]
MDRARPSAGSRYDTVGSGNRRDSYGSGYSPQQLDYRTAGSQNAGYSNDSYSRQPDAIEPVKGGRDEEMGTGPGWDVYADFNNSGPRYSAAFGVPGLKNDSGYRPLSRPDTLASKSKKGGTSTTYEPEVELVTVPAMGAEWSAQELKDMKGSGKAEIKAEKRRKAWNAFKRDQTGLFGIPWLTRKVIVWAAFAFFICLGLILFFVIPRVPTFGFAYGTPLVENGGPTPYFNRYPANFSFTGGVDLQADTHGSYTPVHFKNITAEMYSADTFKLVATGSTGPLTMPAKSYFPLALNMTFSYSAVNTTDQTWNLFHDACQNKIAIVGGNRPGLNVRLLLTMQIAGLVGSYGAATLLSNVPCPIQLPLSAG